MKHMLLERRVAELMDEFNFAEICKVLEWRSTVVEGGRASASASPDDMASLSEFARDEASHLQRKFIMKIVLDFLRVEDATAKSPGQQQTCKRQEAAERLAAFVERVSGMDLLNSSLKQDMGNLHRMANVVREQFHEDDEKFDEKVVDADSARSELLSDKQGALYKSVAQYLPFFSIFFPSHVHSCYTRMLRSRLWK